MPKVTHPSLTTLRNSLRRWLPRINVRGTSKAERVKQLRALHAVGTLLQKHLPGRAPHAHGLYNDLADLLGHTGSWLHRVRQFADAYTATDLEELCKAAEHLGFAHIQILLPVINKRQRTSLQRKAARFGWSTDQLRQRIRRLQKPSRGGGPKLTRPDDYEGLLQDIAYWSQQWRRRSKEVWLASISDMATSHRPAEFKGLIDEVLSEVRAIRQAARQLKVRLDMVTQR